MTNHYTHTVSAVFLLFFLFISSASSRSFIRQYTDDFNTNFQQENGARPNPIQGEAHYLHKHDQGISSRDYKVSASNTVKGLRDRPPSSYSLKMESFNTLLKSTNADRYISRPFSAAGYNWTLVVYPNGNKNDNGAGFLSLYAAIDNSTLAPHQEVYVDLRFYVFNRIEKKYFTIQDTDGWRFNYFKTMWGFSQVLPVNTFKDSNNGYLYDGDHCEFGVDVTTPTVFEKSELFSVADKFYNARYTWTIRSFSTYLGDTYYSNVFSIGGRSWNIQVNPSGRGTGEGKALSMFLILNANEKFRPYERIYVRAKLRVLNQRKFNDVEKQIDNWYNGPGYGDGSGWGYNEFIPLSDLKDSSKGFVVNDVLMVQAELENISSTKYFPTLICISTKSGIIYAGPFGQQNVDDNFYNAKYTWTIRGFSTLLKDTYYSDLFSIGGRSWKIQVNPKGRATGEGKALSMYLNLDVNEKFRPYEKIYVRAKLRVLNQRGLNSVERQLDNWYQGPAYGTYSWGYHEFISFSDLRDSSKGLVVNDVLMVQAELEDISSTTYLPS